MSLLLASGAAPVAPSIIQGWFEDAEDDWGFDEEQQAVFWVADAVIVVQFVDSFKSDLEDDEEDLPPDQQGQWIDFIQTIFRVPDEEVDEEDELADYSSWPLQDDLIQVSFDLEDEEDEPTDYIGFLTEEVSIISSVYEDTDEEDELGDFSAFIPDSPAIVFEFVDSFRQADDDDFCDDGEGTDFEAISFASASVAFQPCAFQYGAFQTDICPTPSNIFIAQTNMRQLGAMHKIDVKQVKMYRSMKMH
jgi:hypothetical protein